MKKVRIFLLLALLLPCMVLSVFAEHYDANGGSCVFNGSAMTSTFSSSALSDSMSRLEPGDDVTITIALKNSGSDPASWYMTNSVLKSLEDSKAAAGGGAYEYRLSYVGPDGSETVFYDSSTVGGELGNIVTATGALNNYFFVGKLTSGQTGTVRLHVALDGETQGNSYQSTMAKLQMNFAVEKNSSGGNTIYYGPKTGDVLYTVGWGAAFVGSAAAIVLLLRARRKLKKGGRA